jgi:hypothetical protein
MGFPGGKKLQKEVGMKKFIVIALALFLAVPALSFAGTVDSRWDVTIGGYIKFDMGWTDQSLGADYYKAERQSLAGHQNQTDEFGNFFTAAGETKINFLIKGPDGWGAKTIGFIEGDFRGSNAGATYGVFQLRHAFMRMQWAADTLTIGQTWQKWGLMPSYANTMDAFNMLGAYNKGSRQPQIMWEHSFTKNWGLALGVISPANSVAGSLGTAGGATRVDSFTLSKYPFGEGEFSYTSDACGKIGPWQMLFSVSGFYGKERQVFGTNAATVRGVGLGPCIGDGAGGCVPTDLVVALPATRFSDKLEDAWGLSFKGFIPIIPEKKGDKTGALSLSGALFASQNPSFYWGPLSVGSYARANNSFAQPLLTGGWGQISYFFTDKLFISGWYGDMGYKYSQRYRYQAANANNVEIETQYIGNLSYDVNAAMRLSLEYDRIFTRYAWFASGVDRSGTMNAVRIAGWYFF